ncbi:cytochrome P450 704C1-like isoform X2 [Syzygium oleosum]|uniref:cytochrome P450 704C1-like isoform X2 n=1 Tax=Syzygium oleosum TaxID=219896 RepID=UPI0024B95A06|nr:cytochrome P450 704C1-like isoform X2 [Syzygium oleosum]
MDINIVSAMLYSMALVLVALSIAFVLLLLKIFTGKSLRTSKYPPVHGTVFGQIIYFSRLYDYQTGVARRSPTFRLLAPDQSEIYTVDTRNVEHILKTKFEEYTKGEYNIDIAKDLFGEGIFAVDGDKWRKQRKVASFEFATRVLRDFSCCVFRKNAAKLVKVVEELSAASEIFDMQNDKEDILSRFLLESEKDPENMNDKYLRDVILNFMIAGKDTSANTLSWFLYMLCKHPLVQQKIFDEIKEVIGDQVSEANADYFVEKITDLVLDRMYYLHATLTETLRLYPAVPADGRCAEADDVLPDGFHVKKGDGVYFLAYSMGRMHNIWGEDAEDFKPERWLKDGIFQNESPFKFVAFNAGPRICLGKDFAYRQMKIVSIALLRFFRFRLADETRPVTYKVMFTLHIDNGLHLHAVPRLAA